MFKVKIMYRVLAVRSREKYAKELIRSIGEPESSIMWDEDLRGCPWNNNRTCRQFLESDGSFTHLLLIDDDAVVVNGFKEIVETSVSRFPDAIWTFFDNTHSFKDRPKHTPYIELFNKNMRGICKVMPRQYIAPFLDFWDTRIAPFYPKWNHEDTAKKMFALLNNIRVMATIPCLVNARQIKSAIPTHHNITRNTDCWQGKDISKEQFLTSDYEVDRIRTLFMTHLKKDEPICVECAEKFARNKILEKIQSGGT